MYHVGVANKMLCVPIMAETSRAKQTTTRTGYISTAATVGEKVQLIMCMLYVKFTKCYIFFKAVKVNKMFVFPFSIMNFSTLVM